MDVDFLEREAGPMAPALPLRQAAMLLHSMTEPDRRWMLARLEPAQRTRVHALLEDLHALDFPIDAALVRESLEAAVHGDRVATPRSTGMSGWSADQAANVLLDEPDDLIALVLRAGEWPWAPALRTRLGVIRSGAVEASRYSLAAEISPVLKAAAVKAATTRFAALDDAGSARRAP